MLECLGLFVNQTVKMLELLGFFVNHTVKMLDYSDMHGQNAGDSSFFCKKWLSFRPVAHCNRRI